MYKFRNLACNIPTDTLCSVNGEFADGHGVSFGVLEWCHDEEDAKHIIEQMSKDSRFKNLTIVDWSKVE